MYIHAKKFYLRFFFPLEGSIKYQRKVDKFQRKVDKFSRKKKKKEWGR